MSTSYSRTPPIEPGYYWLSPKQNGIDNAPEIGLLTRSRSWLLCGYDELWTSDEIISIHERWFGPLLPYLGVFPSENAQHCPGCLSRQQTVSMLRSDLNIANRDYRQLLDRDAELDRQIDKLNAQLVDAIHWRDQYRRELETIRRGVDTTQMGE